MSSVRVLQIVDTLGMGGAETWLMDLARFWSKHHMGQLDFLCTSGNQGIFDGQARALGAEIYYVRYGRSHVRHFANEFRQILRKGRYNAVHDHQDYASGWHFLVGGRVLPPIRVTHIHNPAYQIINNYGVTPVRRLTAQIGKRLIARYSTHVTGTSRQVLTEYGFDEPSFDRLPKAALYCGIDPKRFLGDTSAFRIAVRREFGWPDNSKVILIAGRLDQSPDIGHPQNHKNSAFAVSVGIECVRQDSRVRLLFAGALSPAISILEERIARAGFTGRAQFAGIRKDIERIMIGSDVLLFPSRGEGLGMVAVEAQAAGLPVLASTAVPRECVVMPDLVRFQDLAAGPAKWASELLQLSTQSRDIQRANQSVADSAFSIESSSQALFKLYSTGVLA